MSWEVSVLLWLQENFRGEWIDPIWIAITKLGDHGLIWIITLVLFLIYKPTRKAAIYAIISFAISMFICSILLKPMVQRTRPYEVIDGLNILVSPEKSFSFPSGHTCSSFSVAWMYYFQFQKRYGILFMILACLIAVSRLVVGVHYPTDVLGGFAIATIVAVCVDQVRKKREESETTEPQQE